MTRLSIRHGRGSTATALLAYSASLALLGACAAKRSQSVKPGVLAPCPRSPNCVSSDARDAHFVMPYELGADAAIAWAALIEVVTHEPRTRSVTAEADYLHVESSSRIFRFVDDVEFQLRPDAHLIAVRSASRTGHSDLGVNRGRVERIRAQLKARGVVK